MSSQTTGCGIQTRLPTSSTIERSTARYLLAVADLLEASDDRVATGELCDRMDVSAASVTEMVSKLHDRGLLHHEKYEGVTLTDRGMAYAESIAWRVCVVSTFFDSVLDAPIDQRTAFDIGYTLPEGGVRRLHERVSSPCLELCPEAGIEPDECTA